MAQTATHHESAPRIVGRYALHREIASGGMASVHLGRTLGAIGFSRLVAIKRLHATYAKDPDFVAMFVDEARLAARIHHPNVVATLDVVSTDGELFLVMEYVHGLSLSKLLSVARDRSLSVPLPIAIGVACGLLDGLHAAHEATTEGGAPLGIVHRDVSPQNVIVGADGVARVIDFGVAKATDRLQTTRDGQLKGKLAYMAREQLEGGVVDRRTDVYAASVVIWELLTQTRLFRASSEAQVVTKVLVGATEPPSVHREGISPEIDRIVMRGLAGDRDARWPTARDMARALEAALPPLPAREIGAWVQQIAGDEIARRAPTPGELEAMVRAEDERTLAAAPLDIAPPARARWPLLLTAAVGATALLFVLIPRAANDNAPAAASAAAVSVAAPPSVTSAASVVAAASAAVPAAASVAVPAAASVAASSVSTASPPTVIKPKSGVVKKAACNPPYTVDENGVHRFKRECL